MTRLSSRVRGKIARALSLTAIASLLSVGIGINASHAGVLMEGFYTNVPSGGSNPYWWDTLSGKANEIRLAGFTAIWLPPCLKGNSGGYSTGYDPFDDYDIGSKNQKGTIPTHYGTREQLEKCVATLRANGLDVYLDIVNNHRDGDDGYYNFYYADAYGNATGGRFQKGQWDFHPNVPEDPDVWDGSGEVNFGRDLAPMNGASHWVYNGLEAAGDWLTKALDIQGYRLDYVKGISTDYQIAWLNYGAMANKFSVGEFFDTTLSNVQTWQSTMMQNKSSAFDFPLRAELKNMCQGGGYYDMTRLDHAGLAGVNPAGAVTFVENHDTDGNDPITQNKMLAYAYILTSEGYPCVFYRDWSSDPGSYNLKTGINNLIWIHEKLASGTTQQRWKDSDVFAYERMGGGHLLVGLNDNGSSPRTVHVATGFGANVTLHDYTGHEPDTTTDGSGNATITIPADVNGGGYTCYAPYGASGGFTASQYSVTQEYAGAQDLDIKPADNTQLIQVCRVYVQSGKSIGTSLYYDTTSWTGTTSIYLELDNTSGTSVATKSYSSSTTQGAGFSYTAPTTGFYTLKIRSYNTPTANPKPNYWLKVTYTAPQS